MELSSFFQVNPAFNSFLALGVVVSTCHVQVT